MNRREEEGMNDGKRIKESKPEKQREQGRRGEGGRKEGRKRRKRMRMMGRIAYVCVAKFWLFTILYLPSICMYCIKTLYICDRA